MFPPLSLFFYSAIVEMEMKRKSPKKAEFCRVSWLICQLEATSLSQRFHVEIGNIDRYALHLGAAPIRPHCTLFILTEDFLSHIPKMLGFSRFHSGFSVPYSITHNMRICQQEK